VRSAEQQYSGATGSTPGVAGTAAGWLIRPHSLRAQGSQNALPPCSAAQSAILVVLALLVQGCLQTLTRLHWSVDTFSGNDSRCFDFHSLALPRASGRLVAPMSRMRRSAADGSQPSIWTSSSVLRRRLASCSPACARSELAACPRAPARACSPSRAAARPSGAPRDPRAAPSSEAPRSSQRLGLHTRRPALTRVCALISAQTLIRPGGHRAARAPSDLRADRMESISSMKITAGCSTPATANSARTCGRMRQPAHSACFGA